MKIYRPNYKVYLSRNALFSHFNLISEVLNYILFTDACSSEMTMTAGTVVAICQSGGEFVTKDDGTMLYTGGEAHALNISRDMPLNDLKSEISNMFSIDSSTMSIKYFLPINKRTLITVSSDKDLERMMDFHANSLTIDIYVLNKSDNR